MNRETQHLFLKTSEQQKPIGVLAFKKIEIKDSIPTYAIAGSMVDKNDQFEKKTGVAKALGRLNSVSRRILIGEEALKTSLANEANKGHFLADIAERLNLRTRGDTNQFNEIDWVEMQEKFASAFTIYRQVNDEAAVTK